MRKFFKAFFSGSRSGEETLSTGPIEEWRKEQFVLWLKEKEFDQSIVDAIQESMVFDEIQDYTKLGLYDLVMVIPNDAAINVINTLASDHPLIFDMVGMDDIDECIKTAESVKITRVEDMTETLKSISRHKNLTTSSQVDVIEQQSMNSNEKSIVEQDEKRKSNPTTSAIVEREWDLNIIETFLSLQRKRFHEIPVTYCGSMLDRSIGRDIEFPFCQSSDEIHDFSKDLPKFTKLTPQEAHSIENIVKKLKNINSLSCLTDESKLEEIAQNLAIPERFKFFYMNPDSSVSVDDDTEKPFITVQLLLNHRKDLTDEEYPLGAFYFSIVIGPFCIDWSESGIACVRRKDISMSELIEIETVYTMYEIDSVFNTVSKVCCEWSATRKYDAKKTNQQHFVVDLLHRISIMSVINHNRFYDATEPKKKKRTKIKQAFSPYLNYGYFGTWISISTSMWYKLLTQPEYVLNEELRQTLLNAIFEDEMNSSTTVLDVEMIKSNITNDEKFVFIKFSSQKALDDFATLTTKINVKTVKEPNFTFSLLRAFDLAFGDFGNSTKFQPLKTPSKLCSFGGYSIPFPRR
ncbi:hypothetical protein NAEGRDRAFT_79623 [Naegleria gruberi]|uniref:Uncharacterized protein n=1 Tax=Naegleria gruberi TaxID=5762 RepID=D2VE80_NAEGR|nr:uncharacterized protein NAEGRDRAFT_79623 [Naegleria gruberi]EFC44835.1 hypothetical protein NAEGRDRAFT_79623 [Naegleria gruberi]|eukprot:XP_002677579.1 hypothetical protein NAEGRDRAFT_79623 [Naegleria gruberi strain NEG-M]